MFFIHDEGLHTDAIVQVGMHDHHLQTLYYIIDHYMYILIHINRSMTV